MEISKLNSSRGIYFVLIFLRFIFTLCMCLSVHWGAGALGVGSLRWF